MTEPRGLEQFDVLAGEWSVGSQKYPDTKGRLSAAWIEGGAFLRLHAALEDPRFPATTQIIGADDDGEECSCLYSDSRGIRPLCRMTLAAGEWKSWRFAPGFNQRYTGRISADGRTITGRWEVSEDGRTWREDFDLTYTRIG